jgi:hypothetical protein
MKKCTYCGRENSDDVARCVECGTTGLLVPDLPPTTTETGDEKVVKLETLVRDRPKFIIVAGIWAIYLPGLLGNILILFTVLTGTISGIPGVLLLLLSVGCGALCAYLLYRVVKNYNIHKQRAADEMVV